MVRATHQTKHGRFLALLNAATSRDGSDVNVSSVRRKVAWQVLMRRGSALVQAARYFW